MPRDGGYEAGEEGFVAVDRMGNALKLVDRLDFSKNNFAMGNNRGQDSIEFKLQLIQNYRSKTVQRYKTVWY